MKVKTITVIWITTLLALIWCSAAWADRSNFKDHRRFQQVRQGTHSGKFAPYKARKLRKERRRIEQAYHHRAHRHRNVAVHHHEVHHYYPVPVTDGAGGYEFSVGVGDLGWQFAFSGWNR